MLRRALALLALHRVGAGLVLLSTVVVVVLSLVSPWLLGRAVAAVQDENERQVVRIGVAIIGVGVLTAAAVALQTLATGRLAIDVEVSLREQLYAHYLELDPAFHARAQVGELVSLLMVTSGPIRRFLSRSLSRMVGDLLTFLFAGATMLTIAPWLALGTLWPVPIVVWVLVAYSRRVTPEIRRRQELMADLTAECEESLRGVLAVDALDAADQRIDRFDRSVDRWRDKAHEIARMSGPYDGAIENIPNMAFAGLFLVGGTGVIDGRMQLHELVTVLGYVALMLDPVKNLGSQLWTTQKATASALRVFAVLDRTPALTTTADAARLRDADGRVDVRGVTKSFDGLATALSAVELEVAAGRNVTVVGPTGSGKSALLQLLTRAYDPEGGAILLDDLRLGDIDLASLRDTVRLVGSEPHLFPLTVRENLAYGAGDAAIGLDDVRRVTRALGLDDEIERLPDGYDTQVGPGGTWVPTALAQRISIARAFVRPPRVVLLDDVTALLPPDLEVTVVRGLRSLTGDTTVVAVAGRPALLGLADEIVVLDRGAIAARGTFDELVRSSPAFRDLLAAWRIEPDPGTAGPADTAHTAHTADTAPTADTVAPGTREAGPGRGEPAP